MKPLETLLPLALALTLSGCSAFGSDDEPDPEQQFELYKETALAHWDNKDMLRAEGQAQKALAIKDDDEQLQLLVGWSRLVRGSPADLLVAERRFRSLDSDDYRVALGLATVEERLGLAYQEAAGDFRSGARVPPKADPAAKAAEMDAVARERWIESVALYQRVLTERPDERKAMLGLQRVHAHLGERERSVEWGERLVATTAAELAFFRRQLLRPDLSELEEQRIRDNVRDIEDQQIATHLLAATNLFKLGESERAIAQLDLVLAIDPRHPAAHASRGQLRHALGRYDEAIADLDTYLRVSDDPFDHPDVRHAYELRMQCEAAIEAHDASVRLGR